MINLRYPGSMKAMPSGASMIELDYQENGNWYYDWGGTEVAIDMAANRFYVNATSSNIAGAMPTILVSKSLNFDRFHQRSERYDYLNSFDTTSDLPRLHSGRFENPCHHESISGTISLQPKVPVNVDTTILYPCYFDLDSTMTVSTGSQFHKCSKIKGLALATFGRAWQGGDIYSPWFLHPFCWIESEFVHYKWARSGPKSLKEAQDRGLVIETRVVKTSSYISSPNLPTIYLQDATPYGNRIMMYGEKVWGVYFNPLTKINPKFSFASDFSLPNADLIVEQLSRDIPGMYARVRSKLKYPDEIWYNLILAGAKEIKRLDMNNIANLLEIPGMIRSFDKIYKKFLSIKNGSKVYSNPATGAIIKKAACVYLGVHYGIKLTVMDIKEIVKTFRDNPSLFRQLRRRVVSYSSTSIDGNLYNCKSCMKPRSGREITDMRDLCRILGIELSALNAWDLVPWSFVVDWFIPVSDILDSFENIARLESTYDLEYLLESVSREESVIWNDYRFRVKVYDRCVTDHMPQFGFSVGEASGLNNHVIEASALIINSVD